MNSSLDAASQNMVVDDLEPKEGWVSRNMRKRYGILMLVALAGWTLFGFWPMLEGVLVNGMLLDSYTQLTVLAFVNLVAVCFCVSSVRLLNCRIPRGRLLQRFGDGAKPWSNSLFWVTVGISAITPMILAFFFGSDFPWTGGAHYVVAVFSILIGCGLATGFLIGAGWLKCKLVGSSGDRANFFPFETRDCDGWVNNIDFVAKIGGFAKSIGAWLGLEDADYQFAGYLAILAAAHWLTARWLSASEVWWTSAPTMVVILIWISCMLFAGAANLFDRYRLPVVAVFLVIVTVWQIPWGSARNLESVKDNAEAGFVSTFAEIKSAEDAHLKKDPAQTSETRQDVIAEKTAGLNKIAWEAIEKRMTKERETPVAPDKGKTLVVVTCPGGGIHAAAWAACVLESISAEYSDFADSVCVISGVSGGSVGTLFYVSTEFGHEMIDKEKATKEELLEAALAGSALDLASGSALESIAYGMITDDLYGAFLPVLSRRDRGQRLEDSLGFRLPKYQKGLTMGSWGDIAVEGRMPIVIFNSTDAATGRRILFDTIPTPRRLSSVGLKSRPINYRELMAVTKEGAFDVKPATAARTSATFPYISPFTRPKNASPLGEAVAICDGGYADNEGIVTAVNWVEFLLKKWAQPLKPGEKKSFDRILILRIEPNATVDANKPASQTGLAAWLRWLSGPIETIVNVRSASQSERGNLETDLAALYLEVATRPDAGESGSQVETESEGPRETSYLGTYGATQKGKAVDIQAERTAYQQHNATPEENRKAWQEKLDAFKKSLQDKKVDLKPGSPVPTGAVRPVDSNTSSEDSSDLPVIVRTVAFQNADQVIPLNWKLSKEQKLWYPLSWIECSKSGSPLRKTLDKYFTPFDE